MIRVALFCIAFIHSFIHLKRLYSRSHAYRALELFLLGVREPVVLVVALLVKSLSAVLADERLDALVNSHVRVQRRRPVERLSARPTHVRLLRRVDDLVAAQRRRLAKPFVAHLHRKT